MDEPVGKDVVWHKPSITRGQRETRNGHKAAIVWFTGLSGSGKSTLAHHLDKRLFDMSCLSYVFDGDNVRHGLCSDLSFSDTARSENIRRIGEMVKLFCDVETDSGTSRTKVLFISPSLSLSQANFSSDKQFLTFSGVVLGKKSSL